MSHPIRIRVWDGKQMLEFPDLTEWDIKDYDHFIEACKDGGLPPMLSTGYKDMDGTEIWDCDILIDRSLSQYSSGKNWLVEWFEDRAGFRITYFQNGIESSINFLTNKKASECKVIGNLIQNKNLIK